MLVNIQNQNKLHHKLSKTFYYYHIIRRHCNELPIWSRIKGRNYIEKINKTNNFLLNIITCMKFIAFRKTLIHIANLNLMINVSNNTRDVWYGITRDIYSAYMLWLIIIFSENKIGALLSKNFFLWINNCIKRTPKGCHSRMGKENVGALELLHCLTLFPFMCLLVSFVWIDYTVLFHREEIY